MSDSSRALVKRGVGGVVGAFPPLRRRATRGLTAFLFHDVTDHPSEFARHYDLAVSVGTFRRQAAWIAANYDVIHPAMLVRGAPLPNRAAVITFDDGFLGAFENGLTALDAQRLPSIVFLNMRSIVERRPLIAAVGAYLERFVPAFGEFARTAGVAPPFHLSITPTILAAFEQQGGFPRLDEIIGYQGPLADPDLVSRWSTSERVAFGSHLFDHWNAPALSPAEFEDQHRRNDDALGRYPNHLRMVAFPNGRFVADHLRALRDGGAVKAFSSAGGAVRDPSAFLLDRCSLYQADSDAPRLWFRALRAKMIANRGAA